MQRKDDNKKSISLHIKKQNKDKKNLSRKDVRNAFF